MAGPNQQRKILVVSTALLLVLSSVISCDGRKKRETGPAPRHASRMVDDVGDAIAPTKK
jgi:hypothetical protein